MLVTLGPTNGSPVLQMVTYTCTSSLLEARGWGDTSLVFAQTHKVGGSRDHF